MKSEYFNTHCKSQGGNYEHEKVSIPLGYLAAMVWHMDPFWIYFLLRVEFPLKGLICLGRYLTGKWITVIKA